MAQNPKASIALISARSGAQDYPASPLANPAPKLLVEAIRRESAIVVTNEGNNVHFSVHLKARFRMRLDNDQKL